MPTDVPLVRIRDATDGDWTSLYPIFASITKSGLSFAYPEDASADQAHSIWMSQGRVVVAESDRGILGTATMGPNRVGRGAHIATGSFMVAPEAQGCGVGRALGQHMIEWAFAAGYRGIQFNAVVETNAAAVHLWHSLGFEIIGTVPAAFDHPNRGYVGLHVMHRPLP